MQTGAFEPVRKSGRRYGSVVRTRGRLPGTDRPSARSRPPGEQLLSEREILAEEGQLGGEAEAKVHLPDPHIVLLVFTACRPSSFTGSAGGCGRGCSGEPEADATIR
jgi:hypothetical protein